MDSAAKVTAKGQVTVPKSVRDALGIGPGDALLFRVHGRHAVLARTPDFLELAGSINVPPERQGASWEQLTAETRADRAERRR